MKIKKLVAENFKSYDKLVFEPQKVTYAIVGKNGAGKTSTQQAIRYALTGDVPDDAVKAGQDQLEVNVLLANGVDFTRTKSNTRGSKVKLNGKTTTGKMLTEYFQELIDVPMEAIKLASSAELVEHLKPDEFGEFIMHNTPEELDVAKIEAYMGAVDPAVTAMLEEYIPKGEKFGYKKISEVYAQLTEQRKNWKKELEERQARLNAFSGDKPIQTMAEVNAELEKIVKREGEIEGLKLAQKTYKSALESRMAQEKSIAELEAQIKANTSVRPVPTQLAEIRSKKQKINVEIVSLTSVLRTMESSLALFQGTLDNLNKPFCPLSERLCCTTDKSALKEEFEESVKATSEGIVEQKKLIESKRAELPELNDLEKQYNENAMAYNGKVMLLNQLEKRKKELIIVPEEPKALPVDPEALEETKHNLYVIRDRILAWVQHEKDEDEAATFAKKWKVADILCGLLRPNGIVSTQIVGYYIEAFEAVCNDTLAKINPDYKVRFIADKGVKIECCMKPGMGYVPYANASSGERACIIFAIMDLKSRDLTNLNIMLLDDLDKLDKETFNSLIDFVMQPEIQELYDHIIICAVNHEDTVNTLKSYSDIELHMI